MLRFSDSADHGSVKSRIWETFQMFFSSPTCSSGDRDERVRRACKTIRDFTLSAISVLVNLFRVSCVDSLAIIRSAAHSVRRICNASHRANVTAGLPVKVARVCLLGRNDPLLLAPVLCFKVRGWWTGLETGTGPWQKRACARADSEDRLLPPETLRHVFAFTVTPVYKSAPIYRITPSPPPLLIIFSLTAFDSDRTGPKWRRGSSYSRFCLNLIITF